MKKISELSTKTFLGASGAAENSYVLINYEDSTTNEPVTYKATIQELGKAIAKDQQLYKDTSNGPRVITVEDGEYSTEGIEKTITYDEATHCFKYYTVNDCGIESVPLTVSELVAHGVYGTETLVYNGSSIGYYTTNNGEAVFHEITLNNDDDGNDGGGSFDPKSYTDSDASDATIVFAGPEGLYTYENDIAKDVLITKIGMSETYYNYLFIDPSTKQILYSNADSPFSLGQLVVYDQTMGLGYYNDEGSFVSINLQ